jgi:hypothetical protein
MQITLSEFEGLSDDDFFTFEVDDRAVAWSVESRNRVGWRIDVSWASANGVDVTVHLLLPSLPEDEADSQPGHIYVFVSKEPWGTDHPVVNDVVSTVDISHEKLRDEVEWALQALKEFASRERERLKTTQSLLEQL